jgi:hypothetical protein
MHVEPRTHSQVVHWVSLGLKYRASGNEENDDCVRHMDVADRAARWQVEIESSCVQTPRLAWLWLLPGV